MVRYGARCINTTAFRGAGRLKPHDPQIIIRASERDGIPYTETEAKPLVFQLVDAVPKSIVFLKPISYKVTCSVS